MSKMSATHFKTVVESASDSEKECYHCFLDAMLEEGKNSLRDCHLATTFNLPAKKTHFDDGLYYFGLVYQCDDREKNRTAALEEAIRLVVLTTTPKTAGRKLTKEEETKLAKELLNEPVEILDVPEPRHTEEKRPRFGRG